MQQKYTMLFLGMHSNNIRPFKCLSFRTKAASRQINWVLDLAGGMAVPHDDPNKSQNCLGRIYACDLEIGCDALLQTTGGGVAPLDSKGGGSGCQGPFAGPAILFCNQQAERHLQVHRRYFITRSSICECFGGCRGEAG